MKREKVESFNVEGMPVLYGGYLKVYRDVEENREVVVSSDSVAVLIYDSVGKKVILVNQVRAPMKGRTDKEGRLTEVAAGRFDHEIGVVGLVIAEVKEETGLIITSADVELLNDGLPLALCPGTNTEMMRLAAVEMDLSSVMQDDEVRGVESEGERIKRLVVSIDEFLSMQHLDMKTWALAQWLKNKR